MLYRKYWLTECRTITTVKACLDSAAKAVTDVQSFLSESGQGVETTKALAAAAQEVKMLAEEYGVRFLLRYLTCLIFLTPPPR